MKNIYQKMTKKQFLEEAKVIPLEDEVVTVNEFIRRARKVHGNKYDYSKITITCKKHGTSLRVSGDNECQFCNEEDLTKN
jgi:hypothetical protein